MKIWEKQELQQITSNNSSNIDFKDFTKNLVNDTTLKSDNLLAFNLLERILPSNQSQIIEQAKGTHSSPGKAF